MRAHSHVLIGAGAWWAFCRLDHAVPGVEATAAAVLGSLLPDIDHPQSFIGRRVWFVSLPLARLFGHRGLTHSLLAVLGCAWLAAAGLAWIQPAVQALALGYLSHLLADWLSPAGVPLLWPWRRRFAAPLTFRSGGMAEHLLDLVLLALLAWAWAPAAAV